jgi:hypothetical protein
VTLPPAGGKPAPDPTAALTAEAARLNAQAAVATAEAAKIAAEAALAKAPVAALGLPSYEGTTTLGQGAGAIEALLLATDALHAAAAGIAAAIAEARWPAGEAFAGDFVVLAGDERLDLSELAAMRAEIRGLEAAFEPVRPRGAEGEYHELTAAALAGPIAAIGAIGGLLRSDTSLAPVDHSASLTHRVLATAVAGKLAGRTILPAEITGAGVDPSPAIVEQIVRLGRARGEAAAWVKALPEDRAADGERMRAAIARCDAFLTRVTMPDATGSVPAVRAARLEQLAEAGALVLRLHVEKAGGTLITRKNLWTFFGADPVRVSGALVVSYRLVDPADGRVILADVLNFRTRLATLSEIQAGA